jgi:anaerobic magnesium-protoporphyrin IX monomethyl ester cyclase
MIKYNRIPKDSWGTQVRVEVVNDKELLELLQKAGCDLLYIGLESINEETL